MKNVTIKGIYPYWESYIRPTVYFYLILLFMGNGLFSSGFASGATHRYPPFVSSSTLLPRQDWMVRLPEPAEAGSYVVVCPLPGAQQSPASGELMAHLVLQNHFLSISMDDLPEHELTDIAVLEIYSQAGTLIYRYLVRAGGGEIIVVLQED